MQIFIDQNLNVNFQKQIYIFSNIIFKYTFNKLKIQ